MSFSVKILADENVPFLVVEWLKQNFDVTRPVPRTDDISIAESARKSGRVIVTFDRDFGNVLKFPPREYAGIVFIRIRPPLIHSVIFALDKFFKSMHASKFKEKLFILSVNGVRVRTK